MLLSYYGNKIIQMAVEGVGVLREDTKRAEEVRFEGNIFGDQDFVESVMELYIRNILQFYWVI